MGRYTYYCASYWYRYCEPSAIAVGLTREVVDAALQSAMAEEAERVYMSADCDCGEGDPDQRCDACRADLYWNGVGAESARNLFGARELLAHRRELLAGEVVWLDRG